MKHHKSASSTLKVLNKYLRHLGLPGLFLIAIADSFPIPTFGGPDILTALLSAKNHKTWYEYAGIAMLGSVIGAILVFRMARRAGLAYLNRKFGPARVDSLLKHFERWGTNGLILSTLLPVPFPTSAFFAAAGVLGYPLHTFILIVALSRALRYGAIAALSARYGRHFIVGLQHPARHPGWLIAIAAAALGMIILMLLVKRAWGKVESDQKLGPPS